MEDNNIVSIKVYYESEDPVQNEVRRFGIKDDEINFEVLTERLFEVFPKLSGKDYILYWIDEDNDHILVSSNAELLIALSELENGMLKLYASVKENKSQPDPDVHHMVICDGCDQKVSGCRYKCIVCPDYDLCRNCEKDMHFKHPMLRMASPNLFRHDGLDKLMRSLSSYVSKKLGKHGHHHREKKTHGHEWNSDARKKKRKCDKNDSETDDYDKVNDGKHKKQSRSCLFKEFVGDILSNYLDPDLLPDVYTKVDSSNQNQGSAAADDDNDNEPHHVKYLRSVGNTIVSLLDPLGIDVDVEVRSKDSDAKEGVGIEKMGRRLNRNTEQGTSTSKSSEPERKEVRFVTSEKEMKEKLDKEIEEISSILAQQMVNETPEKEDWVSYEELKHSVNEPSKEAESTSPSCSKMNEQLPRASSSQESKNLYPRLKPEQSTPMDPFIKEALEKMLGMGFTNEGDWLRHLLEAKEGDIGQVIEALSPHKPK